MFFAFWRLPSGPWTFGLLFTGFLARFLGSGGVLGSVLGALGFHFGRPEAPFWEPWGPLVPPGAVLGAKRGAEAILEAKSWFVGPPLGSQNGAKIRPKIVEKSYQKSDEFFNLFLFDFC